MLRSTPAEADSIAIRLGGIYALQQYAVDSRRPDDVEGAEPHDEATSPAPRHRVPPAARGDLEAGWAKALAPIALVITEMGEFLRAELAAGRRYLPAGRTCCGRSTSRSTTCAC